MVNKRQKNKALYIHNEKMYNDCWNLDESIAKFIIPRLKYFKEHAIGYPDQTCSSMEVYKDELQIIINYFEGCLDFNINDDLGEEGLILFTKYFRSLWI